MICVRCKQDKSPHLFDPCEMNNRWPVCSKCHSELSGHEYGKRSKERKGWFQTNMRLSQYEATWDAKKRIQQEEQKRLIENRRKRLEGKGTK